MTIPIERLALGGDGVGRLPSERPGSPNRVVFVPFTAPGDGVAPSWVRPEKNFARGWAAGVEPRSPLRADPRCPVYFRLGRMPHEVCGGCHWQHLSYKAQTDAKRRLLVETFQRIGKIPAPNVSPTVEAHSEGEAWGYRNKGLVPFGRDGGGRIVAGFYAPGSHTVVPFDECPVQNERFNRVTRFAVDWLNRVQAPLASDDADKEGVKNVLVRSSSTGETLVALVTTSRCGVDPARFAGDARRACPFVTSVFQNVNDREGNVVLGPRWRHLSGASHLEERLLGLSFRLSPGSFFQVNHRMAGDLYTLAVEMAAPTSSDVAWELYAGVAAMGQLLSRRCKTVWAVEENASAVRDGIESLRGNGVCNLRFRTGPCENVLGRRLLTDRPTLVVLDPPRTGCDRIVLKQIMRETPRRIVYVSCDPSTLARDALYLSTGGYHLQRSVPVDMFPQTAHIESVSLFVPSRPQKTSEMFNQR